MLCTMNCSLKKYIASLENINEYRLKKIVKLKNQVLNLKHENQLLSKYKDKTKSKVKDQLIEELKQEIADLQYENKMLKEKRQ